MATHTRSSFGASYAPDQSLFEARVAERTVVFLLSSDRSGSTWLGYVLGSSSKSSFLGEFRRAWNQGSRETCAWCSAHGREICEVLGGIEQYPAEQAFELAFARTGKQILIDSSKRIAWAERFVAPGCQFKTHLVHLIRDPRGWYASERRRRQQGRAEMLAEWVRENLHIRNFLELSQIPSSTVFYEDLAAAPWPSFRRLCHEIGCAFDASALRYWEKTHHGFAANGASSPLLRGAPGAAGLNGFITGDDRFYAVNGRKSFIDERWKKELSEEEALAIRDDPQAAAFLKLYDRVMTSESLYRLTPEERVFQRRLEGKFVRAHGDTAQLEKIYLVRAGVRHWAPSREFLERVSEEWPQDLTFLAESRLEKIPAGAPVRV